MLDINARQVATARSAASYIQVQSEHGVQHFLVDTAHRAVYQVSPAANRWSIERLTKPLDVLALDARKISSIVRCTVATLPREPRLVNTLLAHYIHPATHPSPFRAISAGATPGCSRPELTRQDRAAQIRSALLDMLDADLREPMATFFKEWQTYGISLTEIDMAHAEDFRQFFDEQMAAYAVCKDNYAKLDFFARNVAQCITDPRCLQAKLTPLQLFKAAFQLGDIPAIANFRLMHNPAGKSDGKYREWMLHFDNSVDAPEFKLITTRKAGTIEANREQCLAAFPYDIEATARVTRSEDATKFQNMAQLTTLLSQVQGARYVIVRNDSNTTPIEAGLRTERIVHHRSSGTDLETESRDSDLMTFHDVTRCQPFLDEQSLANAPHLSALQRFVLGGFRQQEPEAFMSAMTAERCRLNHQVREGLARQAFKFLDQATVATFDSDHTRLLDSAAFRRQLKAYDALPDARHLIPKLDAAGATPEALYQIVPMLMNIDQNAALKPDCSENRAFPARTELRERTNRRLCAPLARDLPFILHDPSPKHLLSLETLVRLASDLQKCYDELAGDAAFCQAFPHTATLYASRAALAAEYVEQFPKRATSPEGHQVLILFTYYMVDDLDQIDHSATHPRPPRIEALTRLTGQRLALLQHFVSHRILCDAQVK